jgi:hypothetical protein
LQIDHSGRVSAQLEAVELPPSLSGSLSLADVFELRSQIPRGKKDSSAEQMRACHLRLHGVDCRVNGCAQHDGRMKTAPFLMAFSNALRPYKGLLLRRGSAADDAERQRTTVRLDFVTGIFKAGALPLKAVRVRLRGEDTLGSLQTAPQKASRRAAVRQDTGVAAQLDLRAGRVCLQLRVGGRAALDFGTAPRAVPCRAAAQAAAPWRAQSEQELEQAAVAEAANAAEIRESWRLKQELATMEQEKEELARRAAAAEAAAQQADEARAASERAAAERLAKQKARSADALDLAREREGEWRARFASAEQQLIEERRQPDARVRSENARMIAARSEAEREARRLEAANERLARGSKRMGGALERERTERKAAEAQLAEAEKQRVDELRQRDAEQRSSNSELVAAAAAACATVEQLAAQLARAKGLKRVQEAERLEAELEAARAKLARANSENVSLRRSTSAREATRLKEQARTSEVHAEQARQEALRHAGHAEVLQEELEAAAVLKRRADKAHAMALKRGRDTRAEVKELRLEVSTKDARLDAMAMELARREVAMLERQADADARLNEVCARLEAGDARARQMQQELEALAVQLQADTEEAASKHALVEERLHGSEAALAAYRSFQAKEGGAFKDSVRLCYYSLIDKKVPTNQLEAVVTEVLKMVGVQAKALPSRGTAQNMRREMGHVADVVAGVLLAKASNMTGASDDTTKRQRTLAADLAHFRLPDGTLRTLCIGLSCMSSGTAAAKVDRYGEKMAQVQAAARLSVPEFHGDKAAFDRVTLLDLVKNWCSDRCITERNAAKLVEERKAKEARAREGGRQLAVLRVVGCTLRLRVGAGVGGVHVGCAVATREDHTPPPADAAKLVALEAAAREAVSASMEAALPAASEQQLVDAEMARTLGDAWWAGLSATEQHKISRVWAATCNAHRWVNVGNGFDEGIKAAFDAIKAEKAGEGTAASGTSKGGAPYNQQVYETTKMLCMNARKMNVAIGQDLLGQQARGPAHALCRCTATHVLLCVNAPPPTCCCSVCR